MAFKIPTEEVFITSNNINYYISKDNYNDYYAHKIQVGYFTEPQLNFLYLKIIEIKDPVLCYIFAIHAKTFETPRSFFRTDLLSVILKIEDKHNDLLLDRYVFLRYLTTQETQRVFEKIEKTGTMEQYFELKKLYEPQPHNHCQFSRQFQHIMNKGNIDDYYFYLNNFHLTDNEKNVIIGKLKK